MTFCRPFSWIVLVLLGVLCVSSATAFAQVQAYATSGTYVRPGSWGVLNGRVVNRSENDIEGQMVVAESTNKLVQFSTSVWAPAMSVTQMPIPFITTMDEYGSKLELEVRLWEGDAGPGSQILFQSPGTQPLSVDDGDFPTAIYWELGVNNPSDMLMKLRGSKMRKGRVAYFDRRNRPYPSNVLGLLSFTDVLMATSDRLTPVQALAVRQWLVQGGHLWVMADRVHPDTARLVLGDDWTLETAQETELANVVVEEDPRRGAAMRASSPEKAGPFEEPIRMVRVVTAGMDVTHTIEKWPAIMWRNVGRGQLLVTTFDIGAMDIEAGREPEWYKEISDRFLTPGRVLPPGTAVLNAPKGSAQDAMHELASGLVGHEVVKRGPVLAILGGMCVLLLVVGLVAQKRTRLEYAAPGAVVLSLIATAAMVFLGAKSKGTDPLTLASMSDARVVAGSGLSPYTGAVDIYSPHAFEGTVKAPVGSWVLPDLASQAGHIVRLSWRELEPMRWQHLQFPSAATLRTSVGGAMPLPEKVAASGGFGAEGLEVAISGSLLASGQELRLTGPSGRFELKKVADNKYLVGPEQALSAETAAGSGMITHKRAELIKAMQPSLSQALRDETTLYAWTDKLDPAAGIESRSGDKPERQVLTLAALPVEFRSAPAGAAVQVPSGLMRISNYRIRGLTSSSPYNEMTGEFQKGKIFGTMTALVRFQLPRAVAGMHVKEASVKVSVNASPDRTVRVFAMKAGGKTERDFKDLAPPVLGPIRPIEPKVGDIPEIQPDAEGNILVGVDVSRGTTADSYFEIEDVKLTVSGQMPEAAKK